MFPMTLWVHCNPQEAPSEHSCPSENPDRGGIRIVRFLIEFEGGLEAFLGGVSLTSDVPYDPIGPL